MFYDIVFPQGNELEFVAAAKKLGIAGLCLVYPSLQVNAVNESLAKLSSCDVPIKALFELKGQGAQRDAHRIRSMNKLSLASAPGSESRDVIARHRPDIIYNLELSVQKDFAKSRNSGLDSATCQIAKINGVTVAFSFSSVLSASSGVQAATLSQLFGRMMQNITFCQKYKVPMLVASFARSPHEMRAPHDLRAFFSCLGMNTASAKQSLDALQKLFG